MASPHGYSQTGIALLNAELAKRGIGPAAASGAISGIMGESGGNLDPTSFNTKDPGGGSGGIAQWNRGRLIGPSGMLAFARNAGVPVDINTPTDARKVPLAIQAQYLGHELDTTYAGVAKQLRGVTNPQDALNIWVKDYEAPADTGGALRQRSQYLAPVAAALGSSPPPGTTLNAAGGPPAVTSGPPAAPAIPAAPAAPGALPGFQAGSAAEKMANAGLKQLAGGGGGDAQPMQLQSAPPAQAVGGPMMMGAGGQNMQGRMAAMQSLAQQGFLTQPSVAAFTPSMPGTTLNSPSQLLALQAGLLKSPYDSMSNPSYYTGAG